ncbi:hypothetical protein V2W30_19365 [Streptomyces sp. Q6]|uniref:Uncharacterized protein n=1 Tax=Streptomyces citrinus TaxID=3118173 RepID=A0ACD5ADG5_9ACTN
MSAVTSTAAPGRRALAWARALLTVAVLLLAPLAAAPADASAPPPATASCEPGELHQDTAEAALRLPTGHPTRLPTTPRVAPGPTPAPLVPATTDHLVRPSHRVLRTVVLRC